MKTKNQSSKTHAYLLVVFTTAFLFFTQTVFISATTVEIDTTFGNNGYVEDNSAMFFRELVFQKDGKFVVLANNWWEIRLTRYNTDGTIDNDFDTNTRQVFTEFQTDDNWGMSALIQPDGKILVSAAIKGNSKYFHTDNYDVFIFRFNTNGTLDQTFGTNGFVRLDFAFIEGYSRDLPYKLLLQNDGKIIVVSDSLRFVERNLGESYTVTTRLNANGQTDESFGAYGRVSQSDGLGSNSDTSLHGIVDARLQADGKILIGKVVSFAGYENEYLLFSRYNFNGTIDESFGERGSFKFNQGVFGYLNTFEIIGDNKILFNTSNTYMTNQKGGFERAFGFFGQLFVPHRTGLNHFTILPNGKILACGAKNRVGMFAGTSATLNMYSSNGQADETFGSNGERIYDRADRNDVFYKVAVQADGKILAAGQTNNDRLLLVRFSQNNSEIKSQKNLKIFTPMN